MLGLGNKMTKSAGQVTASTSSPTVRLLDVSGVGETTATFSASFSSDTTVTAQKFEYDTNSDFSTKTTVNISPIETSPFDADVTGLTAGQTYYHRAIVTNGDGTTTTPSESFNTVAASGSPYGTLIYESSFTPDASPAVSGNANSDYWATSAVYSQVAAILSSFTDSNSVTKNNVIHVDKELTDSGEVYESALLFLTGNRFDDNGFSLSSGNTYTMTFDVFMPSTNSGIDTVNQVSFGGVNVTTDVRSQYGASDLGDWKNINATFSNITNETGLIAIFTNNEGSSGATSDDEVYFANIKIYEAD